MLNSKPPDSARLPENWKFKRNVEKSVTAQGSSSITAAQLFRVHLGVLYFFYWNLQRNSKKHMQAL